MSFSKFHLSLNVRDLPATAKFVAALLGQQPAQLHADYAKFELVEPALVLSLVLTDIPAGAGLNHIGFRLADRPALAALEQRLIAAGIAFERQVNVACCHSQQTKFWVPDPAGNLWELYVLEDSPQCEPAALAITALTPKLPPVAAAASWGHRLGMPLPDQIPATDGSLAEVVLEGTFNARATVLQMAELLGEAARVLCAGGKLVIRGVTADRPLSTAPRLPGPAAGVEHVPTDGQLLAAVKAAGFVGLNLVTFGESYRFEHAGAELRETRLWAWLPGLAGTLDHVAIYRGPFSELHDDSGLVFRRGQRVCLDQQTLARLRESGCAEQFVFFPAD